MSGDPDVHGLSRLVAVLEERMNTVQADYRTDIARLAEDMAKRETERTKHDATARWWQTAITLAGFGVLMAWIGVAVAVILSAVG